jgi:hypothetical protein
MSFQHINHNRIEKMIINSTWKIGYIDIQRRHELVDEKQIKVNDNRH